MSWLDIFWVCTMTTTLHHTEINIKVCALYLKRFSLDKQNFLFFLCAVTRLLLMSSFHYVHSFSAKCVVERKTKERKRNIKFDHLAKVTKESFDKKRNQRHTNKIDSYLCLKFSGSLFFRIMWRWWVVYKDDCKIQRKYFKCQM